MSFTVKIDDLTSEGEGVGSLDGLRCFIPGVLPGETVQVELVEKRKNFAKGRLVSIEVASPLRVSPPCRYYPECGGCQLQHLSYEGQLAAKTKRVQDALQRIGKIDNPLIHPAVASPLPFHYRNKIQLPIVIDESGIKIGLFRRGTHEIIDIEECLIHDLLGESVYKRIRASMKSFPELSYLILKSSLKGEEILVTFVTRKEPSSLLIAFAKGLVESIPEVRGVVASINRSSNNVILGKEFQLLAGSDAIEEKILGLSFKISSASFFQVNPLQAENLYTKALSLADLDPNIDLLDAYCGVGTLSLLAAKRARSVIGIECVKEAIHDAEQNAKNNGIENVKFFVGKTEELIRRFNCPVVLLNPPRKGCDERVIEMLIKQKPKKIVYISCDPSTLARDVNLLVAGGFRFIEATPFDMFPQTAHIETVALLEMKN